MAEWAATHRAPKVSFGAGFLLCLCLGQGSHYLGQLTCQGIFNSLLKGFFPLNKHVFWSAASALCTDVSPEAVEVSLDLALLGPSCYLSAN